MPRKDYWPAVEVRGATPFEEAADRLIEAAMEDPADLLTDRHGDLAPPEEAEGLLLEQLQYLRELAYEASYRKALSQSGVSSIRR